MAKVRTVPFKAGYRLALDASLANNSDIARVGDLLKDLRNVLKETLEIQI